MIEHELENHFEHFVHYRTGQWASASIDEIQFDTPISVVFEIEASKPRNNVLDAKKLASKLPRYVRLKGSKIKTRILVKITSHRNLNKKTGDEIKPPVCRIHLINGSMRGMHL